MATKFVSSLLLLLFVIGFVRAFAPGDEVVLEDAPVKGVSIRGVVGEDGQHVVFRGIPYAEAPVGERRWKAPEMAHYEAGTEMDGTAVGNYCPQGPSAFGSLGPVVFSEDCLNLNVWVPLCALQHLEAVDDSGGGGCADLDVMVFIHGGAFVLGSGSDPYIDGAAYNRKGVILVSMNYRLGPLGFLAHPALTEEDPENPTNFGLLDQRLALQWVSQNIGQFGGAAAKVTIFGESAGGVSVSYQLVMDGGAGGLFRRAIAQSGPAMGELLEDAEAAGVLFAEALGMEEGRQQQEGARGTMEFLRRQSWQALLGAVPGFGAVRKMFWHTVTRASWVPVVDGVHVPALLPAAFEGGMFDPDVDVMFGTTRDEGTLFVWMSFALSAPEDSFYSAIVSTVFDHMHDSDFDDADASPVLGQERDGGGEGNDGSSAGRGRGDGNDGSSAGRGEGDGTAVSRSLAHTILELYDHPAVVGASVTDATGQQPSSSPSPYDKLSAIVGDLYFQCMVRNLSRLYYEGSSSSSNNNGGGGGRVYRYLYDHLPVHGLSTLGVYHASELPFQFGVAPGGFIFPDHFTPEEASFSDRFVALFSDFATSGVPHPDWPAFRHVPDDDDAFLHDDDDDEATYVIAPEPRLVHDFRGDICDFWAGVYPTGLPEYDVNEFQEEPIKSYVLNNIVMGVLKNRTKRRAVFWGLLGVVVISIFFCCVRRPGGKEKKVDQKKKKKTS